MKTTHDAPHYRQILTSELARRCQRNPLYSQRAFARDLALRPGRLNEILNGKKGLSRSSAAAIAARLSFSKSETAHFCDLVESAHGRNQSDRELARLRLRKLETKTGAAYKKLKADAFAVIADWYHFAILEAMTLPRFQSDPKWIAKNLSISVADATLALDRLERLQFITKRGKRYVLVEGHTSLPDDVPSDHVKRFHEQILQKATQAVFLQSRDRSEFNTTIVALEEKRLPEAKAMIKDFWKDFCRQMESSRQKDTVYCLSTQLFELSGSQS